MKRYNLFAIILFAAVLAIGCDGGGSNDNDGFVDNGVQTPYEGTYNSSTFVANYSVNSNNVPTGMTNPSLTIHNNIGTITGDVKEGSTVVGHLTVRFMFSVNKDAERHWTFVPNMYTTGSTYTGYEMDITWGDTIIKPTMAAILNTDNLFSMTWVNDVENIVSGKGRVAAKGYTSQTVIQAFDAAHSPKDYNYITNASTDGIAIGCAPLYVKYAQNGNKLTVYPDVVDESVQRLVGNYSKFYK